MGLVSKAAWLAAGYVLGARAGTARYQQILRAARTFAARPELQPYLGPLTGHPTPTPTPTPAVVSPAAAAYGDLLTGPGQPAAAPVTRPLDVPDPLSAPGVAVDEPRVTRRRRRRAGSRTAPVEPEA